MVDSRLIDEVLEAWTTHFNHLATPQNASSILQCKAQKAGWGGLARYAVVCYQNPAGTHWNIRDRSTPSPPLPQLWTGSGHPWSKGRTYLKTPEQILITSLTELFNILLKCNHSNSAFILPVHKKGKDRKCTDNYVQGYHYFTPILDKLMEHNYTACPNWVISTTVIPTIWLYQETEAIADATDSLAPAIRHCSWRPKRVWRRWPHFTPKETRSPNWFPTWRYIHWNQKTSPCVQLGGGGGGLRSPLQCHVH